MADPEVKTAEADKAEEVREVTDTSLLLDMIAVRGIDGVMRLMQKACLIAQHRVEVAHGEGWEREKDLWRSRHWNLKGLTTIAARVEEQGRRVYG